MQKSGLHNELLEQISLLNQQLSNDQQAFVDGNQLLLEDSNNSKIAIRNTLESLTEALQNQQNAPADTASWVQIKDALAETASLIQVNQSVIHANQAHYLNLFRALMNVAAKEDSNAYEQHAE